jgi:phosphonoacetaldehyde hydrolase
MPEGGAHARGYRGPLRAVVLDWAGTTVDHGSRAPVAVFVEVFERRGVPISVAQAREPMGAHKRDHIAAILAMPDVAERWQNKHGRTPNEEDVQGLYEEMVPLQLECLPRYAELIPGTLAAAAEFRKRGLRIGSTTGYNRVMLDVLLGEAAARGFAPDAAVSVDDVPAGRPYPWMCYLNAIKLQTFPMEAFVKVGDTPVDVQEGLNAGMWTVAVTKTGNELGLSEEEVQQHPPAELRARLDCASAKLAGAGAHYVVESIADVPGVLDEIESLLAAGERP